MGSKELQCSREFLLQLIYWWALKNCSVRGNSLYSLSTDVFLRITVFEGIPCTADLLMGSKELQCSREFTVQLIYWRALKNCSVLRNSLYSWSTDVFLRITVFEGIPCTADLLMGSKELQCSREFTLQLIYWRLPKNYSIRGNSLYSWSTGGL